MKTTALVSIDSDKLVTATGGWGGWANAYRTAALAAWAAPVTPYYYAAPVPYYPVPFRRYWR